MKNHTKLTLMLAFAGISALANADDTHKNPAENQSFTWHYTSYTYEEEHSPTANFIGDFMVSYAGCRLGKRIYDSIKPIDIHQQTSMAQMATEKIALVRQNRRIGLIGALFYATTMGLYDAYKESKIN